LRQPKHDRDDQMISNAPTAATDNNAIVVAKESDCLTSFNGTLVDLITFMRVSERTARYWVKERLIFYRRQGRNLVFWEDEVIRFAARHCVADRPLKPGELEDLVRREWRKHLAFRATQGREEAAA
jgi:hypothetical protein